MPSSQCTMALKGLRPVLKFFQSPFTASKSQIHTHICHHIIILYSRIFIHLSSEHDRSLISLKADPCVSSQEETNFINCLTASPLTINLSICFLVFSWCLHLPFVSNDALEGTIMVCLLGKSTKKMCRLIKFPGIRPSLAVVNSL